MVVYSISSHQPIYYRELPGNMPDSRTIEMILTELEHAGFRNLVLITDHESDTVVQDGLTAQVVAAPDWLSHTPPTST